MSIKMNNVRKLKAFTLSEMIVTLIVTIIVVGLAFSILNLVQKQMSGIEENFEQDTTYNLLRQSLWLDFRTYNDISYNAKNVSLTCENEVTSVTYVLEESFVIRNLDTLNTSIVDKIFYFDGNEVTSGPIDAIRLISKKEEGSHVIFVYKNNAAETYFK